MIRLASVVVLALLSSAMVQQDPAERKSRLERFRQLSPEQKQRLRERVEQLKKLPPEERRRLKENLKRLRTLPERERRQVLEKIEKLGPEERRQLVELASGFFRWAHRQGYAEGFPREVFFSWLRQAKGEELRRLREMDPSDRKDAFVRLFYEFKAHSYERISRHAQKHGCVGEEELKKLREASVGEFWPLVQQGQRRCRGPRPPK